MLYPLDGPSAQIKTNVTNSTVVEVKAGTSVLPERKVITIQPLLYNIYLYYGDGTGTPLVSTIQTNGIQLAGNGIYTIEASTSQDLYILAISTATDTIIVERS